MTQAQNERRLERVEEKLDKLAEAVVSIARIEERVNTVLKHHDRFFNRLDRLEARVETVENNGFVYLNNSSGVELQQQNNDLTPTNGTARFMLGITMSLNI